MASEEDALLFLIHQHLKVRGYQRAAEVLEEHVTQMEMPKESSTLHDIYMGWMKLCSLVQVTKQDTEDSTHLKKQIIKPEAATSKQEEAAPTDLSNVSQKDDGDLKAPLESGVNVESSIVDQDPETLSEQQMEDDANETQTKSESSPDSEMEEETVNEEEMMMEQKQPHTATNENKASATLEQNNITASPTRQACKRESLDENNSTLEMPSKVELHTSNLTAVETNEEHAASEAPPPEAPGNCESANLNEEEDDRGDEKSKITVCGDLLLELMTMTQGEESDPTDLPVADAAADVANGIPNPEAEVGEADPVCSIVLNIIDKDGEAAEPLTAQWPCEVAEESCEESKTPKEKKRSKRSLKTLSGNTTITETPSTDTSLESLIDSPVANKHAKKKKDIEKYEVVEGEDEVFLVGPPEKKKKKAKKRKWERDEMEKIKETLDTPSENKARKKKEVKDDEEVREVGGVMVEQTLEVVVDSEMKKKKKKKKREKYEELQSEGRPLGDSKGTEEKIEATDGISSMASSAIKKKCLRMYLSMKKRPRLQNKEIKMMRRVSTGKHHIKNKRQKQIQEKTEENLWLKPTKRPLNDPVEKQEMPEKKKKKMKMIADQVEISLNDNQIPKNKKEKKNKFVEVKDQGSFERGELANSNSFAPSKQEKKKINTKTPKGEFAAEDLTTIAVTQDVSPKKKIKKNKLKDQLEQPVADTDTLTPAVSEKKRKSSKKKTN